MAHRVHAIVLPHESELSNVQFIFENVDTTKSFEYSFDNEGHIRQTLDKSKDRNKSIL